MSETSRENCAQETWIFRLCMKVTDIGAIESERPERESHPFMIALRIRVFSPHFFNKADNYVTL